jgi:hypothetical protein
MIASAVFSGSSLGSETGEPFLTEQKEQPLVHISPKMRKVAVL